MESQDNWKHRSTGMRCSTCMYHSEKQHPVGRCKRHAPTMAGFPVVFATDYCGDHKLDENKVIVSESNKEKFDKLRPREEVSITGSYVPKSYSGSVSFKKSDAEFDMTRDRNEHKEGDDALLQTFAKTDTPPTPYEEGDGRILFTICEGVGPGDEIWIDKEGKTEIKSGGFKAHAHWEDLGEKGKKLVYATEDMSKEELLRAVGILERNRYFSRADRLRVAITERFAETD